MSRKPRAPRDPAWLPVAYDAADVLALKACFAGQADPAQQRRALDWLITTAAGTYEMSYRSDADGGERETAFAEGRRFVGLQAVKLVNMPAKVLAHLQETQ